MQEEQYKIYAYATIYKINTPHELASYLEVGPLGALVETYALPHAT